MKTRSRCFPRPRGTPRVLADWVEAAQAAGAVYLDAPVSQTVGKKTVWFSPEYLYDVDVDGLIGALTSQRESMEAQGSQYEAEGGAAYRALGYRIEAYQRTQQALKAMTANDLQIAVNHVPMETSYIRESIEWADQEKVFNFRNISLLLCGHYCGGQWRLPAAEPFTCPKRADSPRTTAFAACSGSTA